MDLSSAFEKAFCNSDIEDIRLSSTSFSVYQNQKWEQWRVTGLEASKVWALAQDIAEYGGAHFGFSYPSLDASYEYASKENGQIFSFRAHLICSPMVVGDPEITFRRIPLYGHHSLDDFDFHSQEIKNEVSERYQKHESFIIAGATGAGKTSFLKSLLTLSPESERILILEDSLEINYHAPHSTHLIARKNKFKNGQGAHWDLQDLILESLRMRPDRLVLGECRGPETFSLYQALNTGHSGLLTTLHGGSFEELKNRYQSLLSWGASQLGVPTPYAPQEDCLELWDNVLILKQNRHNSRRALCEFLCKTK